MRLGPDHVGPRGWLLIAVAGLAGIGLAVHGYGRGAVVVGGPAGVAAPGAALATTAPTRPSPASTATPASSSPAPVSSTSTTAPAKTPSAPSAPGQKLGPLLSSTQYAQYAYQIYPGPESSRARQATAGFSIQVTPHGSTVSLSISVPGSGQSAQTASYPAGDRLYFVEATFGDDSGDSDYSMGDDGVVVTNAQGYLVQ